MVDLNVFKPVSLDDTKVKERRRSKVIVAVAHNEGVVILCDESAALDFVREGGNASTDGFIPSDCGVSMEKCETPGVYIGELRIVDDGPESWEMPDIRNYLAEIHELRPITREEWEAHLNGEWPEGFHYEASASSEA